jgi:flagellar biosynthesis repressor protein FlbT
MPLNLRIPTGEKLIINGAVITNAGDRPMQIRVENTAVIMRQRDIMLPEQADTPLRLTYFHAQMMYIEPEQRERHHKRFLAAAQAAFLADENASVHGAIMEAVGDAAEGKPFGAIERLRRAMKETGQLPAKANIRPSGPK